MACGVSVPGLDLVTTKVGEIFVGINLNFTKNYFVASAQKAMMDAVDRAKKKYMPEDEDGGASKEEEKKEDETEAGSSSSEKGNGKAEKADDDDDEEDAVPAAEDPVKEKDIKKLKPVMGLRLHTYGRRTNIAGNEYLGYYLISGSISNENSAVSNWSVRYSQLAVLNATLNKSFSAELAHPDPKSNDIDATFLAFPSARAAFPGKRWFRKFDDSSLRERFQLMQVYVDALRARPAVVDVPEFKQFFRMESDEKLERRFATFCAALSAVAKKNSVELDEFDDELEGLCSLQFRVIERDVFPVITRDHIDTKPASLRNSLRNVLRTQGGEAIIKMSTAQYSAAKPVFDKVVSVVDKLTGSDDFANTLDKIMDKIFGKIAELMKKKDDKKKKKKKKEVPAEIKVRLAQFPWGKQAVDFVIHNSPNAIQFSQYVTSSIESQGDSLQSSIRQAMWDLWFADLPYTFERPLQRILTLLEHLCRQWYTTLKDAASLLHVFLEVRDKLLQSPPTSAAELRSKWAVPLASELEKYMVDTMAMKLAERRRLIRRDYSDLKNTMDLFLDSIGEANTSILNAAARIRNRWYHTLNEALSNGGLDADGVARSFAAAAVPVLDETMGELMTKYVALGFGVAKVVFVDENSAPIVSMVSEVLNAGSGMGIPGLDGEELAGTIVEKVLEVVAEQILKRVFPLISKWLTNKAGKIQPN